MAGFDVNSDIESDSDSVLELDVSSDGVIRPFNLSHNTALLQKKNPKPEGKNPSIFVRSGSKLDVMFTKI